jgi:hypothetical protein
LRYDSRVVVAERIMRAKGLLAVLALVAGPAMGAGNEIDLGLNADAIRLYYAHTFESAGVRTDGGWLHHQDIGDVAHFGIQVVGKASPRGGVDAVIGARVFYADGEGSNREGYGLAPGVSVIWTLPRFNRVSLAGEAYYAPDILAGGDAEEYIDTSARVAYAVTRQARVYAGVRYVGADFDRAGEPRFDTGLHAGFNVTF